jgi:alpha-glucosidase
MLGSHLLVVPKTARDPHLPAGKWLPVTFNGEEPGKETVQPDVYIKGGAIVPLAGCLLQSTAAYRADSLVLLVCPDSNNKAEGIVYTDAGEGYAYQQGDYEETKFMARIRNRQLTISAKHQAGNWQKSTRFIKVGLVTDKGIRYSGWLKGPEATMRF